MRDPKSKTRLLVHPHKGLFSSKQRSDMFYTERHYTHIPKCLTLGH